MKRAKEEYFVSEAKLTSQGSQLSTSTKGKKKGLRISAKRIFLTFSQVHENLSAEQVLSQLSAKQNVDKYLIAEKRHEDGGKHFHALLESKTKFSIRDPRHLDVYYESDSYHGNYLEARNYKSVAKHVGKDSKYITNYPNFYDGEKLTVEQDMLRIVSELGATKANKYYLEKYTAHALKGMSIINAKSYLQSVIETLSVKKDNT